MSIFSRNKNKQKHADALGVNLIAHSDKDEMAKYARHFDIILDTVAEHHDVAAFVPLMRPMGTIVLLGGVPQPFSVSAFAYVRLVPLFLFPPDSPQIV